MNLKDKKLIRIYKEVSIRHNLTLQEAMSAISDFENGVRLCITNKKPVRVPSFGLFKQYKTDMDRIKENIETKRLLKNE